ncbi:MAG: ABC transporter permease [Syntrophaceticus sp.]|nr:ABC transporter permease [Syntrophaceticus sp.]MDD3314019.1 ABC transporter permease [Syntrophaceticus sp.]MDD4359328.1 ABC transporter permease [Syntrophaceticus sp.]MDD4782268.1 ABC transporter permease [Syntrophaceticus sp.]
MERKLLRTLQSKHFSQILLLLILLVMGIVLSFLSPYFLTWSNFYNILDQTSVDIILAIGMAFVISSGGIDLSIGSVLAYSGIMMAFAMKAGIPVPLAVALGILAGMFIGLCNGLLISRLHLNPLVTTLGFMSIARGFALILTNSSPIFGFPNAFKFIGSGRVGPVNVPIIIALVIVIISYILLNKTKWGYYTLALGGNEEALRRAGVATHKYRTSIYIFCAMMAAIAGMITVARLNSADPLAGWMVETDAIAAVVLGGTSLSGGRGSIVGAVLACFVLGMLDNGLILMAIPAYYQKLFCGLIIIIALVATELRNRKEHRNFG